MDAPDRINHEFDRLNQLGHNGVQARPIAERLVFYVVITRCATDLGGIESVFQQTLSYRELGILADGLDLVGEVELALEFRKSREALNVAGFYEHMDWNKVPAVVRAQIRSTGDRVGSALWNLDGRLTALLDEAR